MERDILYAQYSWNSIGSNCIFLLIYCISLHRIEFEYKVNVFKKENKLICRYMRFGEGQSTLTGKMSIRLLTSGVRFNTAKE